MEVRYTMTDADIIPVCLSWLVTWVVLICILACLAAYYENKEEDVSKYNFFDHELTERASIVFELWAEKVLEHPRVQQDPKTLARAQKINDMLYGFYSDAAAKQVKETTDKEGDNGPR